MGVVLLVKIKIHELAKKLGLTNKEVIEKANNLGIEVKSHLSSISEKEAETITKSVDNKKGKEKNTVSKKEVSKEQPVIMRRTVIIEDEKEEKTEKSKSNVGIVENTKRNKDYNIVYRNKQTKPMSVAELFGIPSKEPKKDVAPKEAPKSDEKKPIVEEKVQKEITSEKKIVKTTETSRTFNSSEKSFNKNNNFQRNNQNSQGNNRNNNFHKNNQNGNQGYNKNNSNNYQKNGYNNNNGQRMLESMLTRLLTSKKQIVI